MNEPIVFRILVAVVLAAFVIHRGYYSRRLPPAERETVDRMDRSPATIAAAILSLAALVSSILYVLFPSLLTWASAPFPAWLRWIGLGVCLAGFVLLEASQRALGRNWSDQPRVTSTQQLVTTGPYRTIRNPIYTSFLLILGALLLISANWSVGISWIASVALDAAVRIRYEERAMTDRFGEEYIEYRKRTGRLFPKL
jgi:protein-S-isoprenylcysteine O-methyltransferase Ste14